MPQTKTSYKVKVNGYEFEFDEAEIAAVDFIRKTGTEASIIHNHQSAKALLVDSDLSGKKCNIELEGSSYQIEIKDELDDDTELEYTIVDDHNYFFEGKMNNVAIFEHNGKKKPLLARNLDSCLEVPIKSG